MKKCFLFLSVLGMLFLSSCLVSKKVVYLNDMKIDSAYKVISAPPIRIQKNDRLSIILSSKNPELVIPFNPVGGSYNVTEKGGSTAAPSTTNPEKGYLVDEFGDIEFPVLGTLNVEGLTLVGLRDLLCEKLIREKLISTPIVKIDMLNLKVMMMGEVNSVGMINVPDSKITLLEAISRSGGLTRNAAVDEIVVIREENGVRKMYTNNIQKADVFNSPTYYLQQNDIVYIRPKTAIVSVREESSWRYISLFAGVIALVTSFLVFSK